MNVTCPSCETVYRVDPGKVPPGGVRARCAVCSSVFPVNAAGAAATGAPSAAAPRAPAASPPPMPAAAPAATAPRPPAPPAAPPAVPRARAPPGLAAFSGPGRGPGGAAGRAAAAGGASPRPGGAAPPPRPAPAGVAPGARPGRRCRAGCAGHHAPRAPGGASGSTAGARGARRRGAWSAHDRPAAARESFHGAGPETEGAAARPGSRVGPGGVPSGEAPAGATGRNAAAALQGRDREELAGIRRAGRRRDCEEHVVLGRGVERDSGRWQQDLLRLVPGGLTYYFS